MDIRTDYRNDEKLRLSLTKLAEATFGIDLETWYQNGFWQDDYIPYSAVVDGKVVSNVSVNVCNIRWKSRIRHLAQLGTVMTDPAYREKGYSRAVMEKVLADCEHSFEGIYLYAEEHMAPFYEKFGFSRISEYQCVKSVNINNPSEAEKIAMDSKEEWDRMVDIILRREQYGDRIMLGNPGLFMFHLTGPLSDCVYYLPSSEVYAVAEMNADELILYAIFSSEKVSLGDAIASFGSSVKSVRLAFTPENSTGFERVKIEDSDNVLFAKGQIFENIKNDRFMFPSISQA
ncbi:MAG: GNAT family N-acetyltransferase [Lachnospiraceae bacterium]|nr:GNAT family N-acetyltransferase [Lachnospiraceae bacterium]